jgi:hypothetical protein
MLLHPDGSSSPGWRDYERALASILGGVASEDKGVFDVIVRSNDGHGDYGFSVKSKALTAPLNRLGMTGRLYMELSNALAQFWRHLNDRAIRQGHAEEGERAAEIGQHILDLIRSWHLEAAKEYEEKERRPLNLQRSVFLTISYFKQSNEPTIYQLHSFDLAFPRGIVWTHGTKNCVRGIDPAVPGATLFDWYWKSGGQLKYYPRAASARFSSEAFTLARCPVTSIAAKTSRYFPREWAAAQGESHVNIRSVADDLEQQSALLSDERAASIVKQAASALRAIR